MKVKHLYIPFLAILLWSGLVWCANSQYQGFWRYGGSSDVRPLVSTWTVGTEASPITAGYFTTMNASSSIIANLYVSNTVDQGDLNVSPGNILVGKTATTTIRGDGGVSAFDGYLTVNSATASSTISWGMTTGGLTVGQWAEFPYFTATSTTATSTIAGYFDIAKGLEVGANKAFWVHENATANSLIVDGTGNVGIGTTSPDVLFAVGSTTPTLVSGYRDAFIAGSLEVDRTIFLNDSLKMYTSQGIEMYDSDGNRYGMIRQDGDDGMMFTITNTDGYANRNFIFMDDDDRNQDFDHETVSTNPTIFLHSALDPDIDNTEFLSLTMTSTSTSGNNLSYGVIDAGTGHNLVLQSTQGNVGIGTTSPWARLSVHGKTNDTYASTLFAIASSSPVATTTHFVVNADGNVGIGTAVPDEELHVVGSIKARKTEGASQDNLLKVLSTEDSSGSDANWRGRAIYGADNRTTLMGVYKGLAAIGAHSWTSADAETGASWADLHINPDGNKAVYIGESEWDPLTAIMKIDNSTGNVGIGTTTPRATLGINDATGVIPFMVGSSTPSLMVDASGNVGIGTESPDALLNIHKDSPSVNDVLFKVSTSTSIATLFSIDEDGDVLLGNGSKLINPAANQFMWVIADDTDTGLYWNNSTAEIQYRLNNSKVVSIDLDSSRIDANKIKSFGSNADLILETDSETNVLVLDDANGNVGIGTTTPPSLLTINGTTNHLFRVASSTNHNIFTIDENGDVLISGDLTVNGDFSLGAADLLDVHATTTQAIADSNFMPITFDVVDVETGDMDFTAYNASTTIPHTADYDIGFSAMVDKTGGVAQTVQVMLFNNNAEVPECYTERTINSNNETGHFGFGCIVNLTANDVIVLKARSSAGESQFYVVGTGVTGDPSIANWTIEKLD